MGLRVFVTVMRWNWILFRLTVWLWNLVSNHRICQRGVMASEAGPDKVTPPHPTSTFRALVLITQRPCWEDVHSTERPCESFMAHSAIRVPVNRLFQSHYSESMWLLRHGLAVAKPQWHPSHWARAGGIQVMWSHLLWLPFWIPVSDPKDEWIS